MDNHPPPRPPRAADAEHGEPVLEGRRSFFLWLTTVGAAAMSALLAVPLVRYALYPVFTSVAPASWSTLGSRSRYASLQAPARQDVRITQIDGWRKSVSTQPVYVARGTRRGSLDGVEVLSAVCPHLGCEVPWNAAEGRFVCPCHGSVFAPDGSLVKGPAARGMDTLPVRTEQGTLQVRYEYFQALLARKAQVE